MTALNKELILRLFGLPSFVDYRHEDGELLRTNVQRILNFALCHNSNGSIKHDDSYYRFLLFPGLDGQKLAKSWDEDDIYEPVNRERKQFFKDLDRSKESSKTHKGHPCGIGFKFGDTIYRCEECGFDDSCVLCSDCFNKEDHKDHFIQTTIASEDNSGCCDCGDPEAWNVQLNCKCELSSENDTGNTDDMFFESDEFKNHLRSVLETCLNYFIGTFHYCPETLPFYIERVESFDGSKFYSHLLKHATKSWVSDNFNVIAKSSKNYLFTIWNDEFHNYDEAIAIIRPFTSSTTKAKEIAKIIDSVGRAVVSETDLPLPLIDDFKKTHETKHRTPGLLPAVFNAERFMQQDICIEIINWIVDLLNHPNNALQIIARQCLNESFLSEIQIKLPDEFKEFNEKERFQRGLLSAEGKLPYVNLDNVQQIKPEVNSLIQYILFFEIRLPKKLRKTFNALISENVVRDLEFKKSFMISYFDIYPSIAYNSSIDREKDLNIMELIRVQVLSSPSAALTALKSGKFVNILAALALLLDFKSENGKLFTDDNLARNFVESVFYSQVIGTVCRDVNNLVVNVPPDLINKFLDPIISDLFLRILLFVQNSVILERKTDEHVATEHPSVANAVVFAFDLVKASDALYDHSYDDATVVFPLLQKVAQLIYTDSISSDLKTIIIGKNKFKTFSTAVSTGKVSFINPLNSLLSMLLENIDDSSFYIISSINSEFPQQLLTISDVSLRSIVFLEQSSIRLWIRNGRDVQAYANLYRSINYSFEFNVHGMMRDLHLVQLGFLNFSTTPEEFLVNVIDRWELIDWLLGNTEGADTVYEERFDGLLSQFVLFFIRLITERKFFLGGSKEEKKKTAIVAYVVGELGSGPKTFYDISHRFVEESHKSAIQDVLEAVSDFKPPVGLDDNGTFSLKEQYLDKLNPYSVYTSSADDVDTYVRAILFKVEKKINGSASKFEDVDDVVLIPKFPTLENGYRSYTKFINTKIFLQLIQKLFAEGFEKLNNNLLHLLLILCHVVVDDNKNNKVSNDLLDWYGELSVCLFDIKNSNCSKHVSVLANELLFKLLDLNESLILESIFVKYGDDAVDSLKNNISSRNDNEETLKKRKLIEMKKNRALERIANQRKLFEANHNINNDDSDEEMSSDNHKTDRSTEGKGWNKRTCIVCQKPQKEGDAFVMVGGYCLHNVFWEMNKDANSFYQAFKTWDNSVDFESFIDNKDSIIPKNTDIDNQRNIIASCNHAMHRSCIRHPPRFEYKCELCGFQGKYLIPCYMSKELKPDFLDNLLNKTADYDDNKQIYGLLSANNYVKANNNILQETLITSGYKDDSVIGELIFKLRAKSNTPPTLLDAITHTIMAFEISSRFSIDDNKDPYSDFLASIPDNTFSFLRNLILFQIDYIHNYRSFEKENTTSESDPMLLRFLIGFLAGSFSFKFLLSRLYVRNIVLITRGILKFVSENEDINDIICSYGSVKKIEEKNVEIIGLVLNDLQHKQNSFYSSNILSPEFIKGLVFVIEKCSLIFLRQILLLVKILTFDSDGDKLYYQFSNFINDNVISQIEDSAIDNDFPETIQPYLDFFKLDNVCDVFSSVRAKSEVANIFFYDFATLSTQIQYPGVVKLIPLPKSLRLFTSDAASYFKGLGQSINDDLNYLPNNEICLSCGTRLEGYGRNIRGSVAQRMTIKDHWKKTKHSLFIFFTPTKKTILVISNSVGIRSKYAIKSSIVAPFINEVGESGERIGLLKSEFSLSVKRYRHIIKNYLNDCYYTDLSRKARIDFLPNLRALNAGVLQLENDQFEMGLVDVATEDAREVLGEAIMRQLRAVRGEEIGSDEEIDDVATVLNERLLGLRTVRDMESEESEVESEDDNGDDDDDGGDNEEITGADNDEELRDEDFEDAEEEIDYDDIDYDPEYDNVDHDEFLYNPLTDNDLSEYYRQLSSDSSDDDNDTAIANTAVTANAAIAFSYDRLTGMFRANNDSDDGELDENSNVESFRGNTFANNNNGDNEDHDQESRIELDDDNNRHRLTYFVQSIHEPFENTHEHDHIDQQISYESDEPEEEEEEEVDDHESYNDAQSHHEQDHDDNDEQHDYFDSSGDYEEVNDFDYRVRDGDGDDDDYEYDYE